MSDKIICGYCKQNESEVKCAECGIDLCEECKKEIVLEETDPAYRHKGISTSTMGASSKKRIVCTECMKEIDVF